MSSTGLPLEAGRIRYRTPAEVREIPNSKWEQWVRNDSVPFHVFSPERACQKTMRTILNATLRRMAAES